MILKIAVHGPFLDSLDYLPPPHFNKSQASPGTRIEVPLRGKICAGILMGLSAESTVPRGKLKAAIRLLDDTVTMPANILKLMQWMQQYYHHPIGDLLHMALPAHLRKPRPLKEFETKLGQKTTKVLPQLLEVKPCLNAAQTQAIESVISNLHHYAPFLLQGVTGSGKTEVYLQIIEQVMSEGKQALILVPEIGLTPQTLIRFQQRFNVPIAVIHSNLNDTERLQAWFLAKNDLCPIVIGTRSAIFTPIPNLGLIVVDEEHDLSFKQHEGLRYSARDLSLVRAHFENIPILLGSATPSLETLHNVQQKKYQLLSLPERAGNANLPRFHLIDLRNQPLTQGLSATLIQAMRSELGKQHQVLLFLNRRGYAPTLLCHGCGKTVNCHRCDARLTLHFSPKKLCCHHCEFEQAVIKNCPHCHQDKLFSLGVGTQKLEFALKEIFPDIPVLRVDRDNTRRKTALRDLLDQIHTGKSQILIGTQMLAKGHHFPNVTLVAILDADAGLCSADFRATERIAQLVIQVAGRAGRAELQGHVYIQTHNPDHALLVKLIKEGYPAFSDAALNERHGASLPPFSHLALLRAESPESSHPMNFLTEIKSLGQANQVQLLGPIPSPMEKRAGRFRAQLCFQSQSRVSLQQFLKTLVPRIHQLKSAKRVKWSLDVDPVEM